MTLDISKYRSHKLFVKFYLEHHDNEDSGFAIANISQSTHVPVLAIAFFAGEIFGWSDGLKRHIDGLIKFYGYTDIKGLEKGNPYLLN